METARVLFKPILRTYAYESPRTGLEGLSETDREARINEYNRVSTLLRSDASIMRSKGITPPEGFFDVLFKATRAYVQQFLIPHTNMFIETRKPEWEKARQVTLEFASTHAGYINLDRDSQGWPSLLLTKPL